MSIYVDVSAAVHHRAGLGRYADSLVRALHPQLEAQLALFYNREIGVEPLAGLEQLPSRTVSLGYKPWRMLVWLGQLGNVSLNRLLPNAQLFHATEHLLPPLKDIPTVLTVHDLIFYHLPEHHKALNRWYLNATMPLYCRRADHIIAVSEATRQDLLNRYHIAPEKITVIYEAADPQFRPQTDQRITAVRQRYNLPERYLLYVGTIEPRKNLTRLLRAWERLYTAKQAPPLVIVGKRGWLASDFFAALETSPEHENVLLTGFVHDQDLPAVYAGATAFVFPSLYEGFGLPPVEAMACGAPVACANTSSLPEVVEDAALKFNPKNLEAMTDTLRRVLNDVDLQADLRTRGLRRAAEFSWARTAQQTLEVYEKLLHTSL